MKNVVSSYSEHWLLIIGVILIVIAALEILWIMRTVQSNMPKG